MSPLCGKRKRSCPSLCIWHRKTGFSRIYRTQGMDRISYLDVITSLINYRWFSFSHRPVWWFRWACLDRRGQYSYLIGPDCLNSKIDCRRSERMQERERGAGLLFFVFFLFLPCSHTKWASFYRLYNCKQTYDRRQSFSYLVQGIFQSSWLWEWIKHFTSLILLYILLYKYFRFTFLWIMKFTNL